MSSNTVSKITDMQCPTMIAGFCDPRGRAAERIVLVMDQLNTHGLGHAFGRVASSNLQKNSDNPSQGHQRDGGGGRAVTAGTSGDSGYVTQ